MAALQSLGLISTIDRTGNALMKHPARVVLFVAGGAFCCAASAANLVTNPDFTSGLNDWSRSTGNGTFELDSGDGMPAAPSLHLVSDPAAPDVAAQTACIAADDSTSYDFSMNAFATSGELSASIIAYSDPNCENTLDTVNTGVYNASGNWATYTFTGFALPAGTLSVSVAVTASIGAQGESGNAHFDHIGFGPSGTLVPVAIDQEGLTGTWYNPNTSGQGLQVAVFPGDGMSDGSLFGAWYTYDVSAGGADAQRWYSFDAAIASDAGSADVTIYRNTGGNFDAPPSTAAIPVGTGTLTFDSCTSGLFTYALDDGRSGAIPVVRLLPNVECVESGTPANPPSDFGLSGAWYNADTSGQGIIVEVNPVDTQAFMGWYTYQFDATSIGPSGQRWFSAQAPYTMGSTSIDMTVYASTGGTFDSSATPVDTVPVGTATISFADCGHATLDYSFNAGELDGQSGSIALTRLGSTPASCGL
jgi:hypothetical protein